MPWVFQRRNKSYELLSHPFHITFVGTQINTRDSSLQSSWSIQSQVSLNPDGKVEQYFWNDKTQWLSGVKTRYQTGISYIQGMARNSYLCNIMLYIFILISCQVIQHKAFSGMCTTVINLLQLKKEEVSTRSSPKTTKGSNDDSDSDSELIRRAELRPKSLTCTGGEGWSQN